MDLPHIHKVDIYPTQVSEGGFHIDAIEVPFMFPKEPFSEWLLNFFLL